MRSLLPLPRADRARLIRVAVGAGVVLAGLSHWAGPQIARDLQNTPVTFTGWVLAGWLVGGPVALATTAFWVGGGAAQQLHRRRLTVVLGVAIGLSMFLFPAALPGPLASFGTGAIVGEPVVQGWLWGVAATLLMATYAAVVMRILERATGGATTARQRAETARFIEVAWVVVLIATLTAALSGTTGGLLREHLSATAKKNVEVLFAV